MKYEDLKVLVVDDHMIIRKLVSTQLHGLGIRNIETASDGEEAVKAMKDGKFDIVFLDWGMPERDGLSVLEECRKDTSYDRTAMIMLTAASEQKSVRTALEAGATSYIVKPMSMSTLSTKLEHAVKWIESKRGGDSRAAV